MSIAPHFGPNRLDVQPDREPIFPVDRPFRLLVTGSRHWPIDQAHFIEATLNRVALRHLGPHPGTRPKLIVVHGAHVNGVDEIADHWSRNAARIKYGWGDGRIEPEPHPADWNAHGSAAGPIRNTEMVQAGADLCLAFPDARSRGTIDCMKKAIAAGIPTVAYSYEYALTEVF